MPLVRWFFCCKKKDATGQHGNPCTKSTGFKSSMSTQATKVLDKRSAHCTKTQAHKFVRKALLGHVFLQGHHLTQAALGYAWHVNCFFSHFISFHDNFMTFRNCLSLWQTGRKIISKRDESHWKKPEAPMTAATPTEPGPNNREKWRRPFRRIRMGRIWTLTFVANNLILSWLNSLNLPGSKNPISNLAKPSIHPKSAEPLQVLHDS